MTHTFLSKATQFINKIDADAMVLASLGSASDALGTDVGDSIYKKTFSFFTQKIPAKIDTCTSARFLNKMVLYLYSVLLMLIILPLILITLLTAHILFYCTLILILNPLLTIIHSIFYSLMTFYFCTNSDDLQSNQNEFQSYLDSIILNKSSISPQLTIKTGRQIIRLFSFSEQQFNSLMSKPILKKTLTLLKTPVVLALVPWILLQYILVNPLDLFIPSILLPLVTTIMGAGDIVKEYFHASRQTLLLNREEE